MIFVGSDPDMHSPSFAVVNDKGELTHVDIIKCKGTTGREAVMDIIRKIVIEPAPSFCYPDIGCFAIESQEVAYSENPRSLAFLANISGAIAAIACAVCEEVLLPAPQAWKGSVPKQIHQARIFSKIGWTYKRHGIKENGYCSAEMPEDVILKVSGGVKINEGDWKHIADAIGLALYAREEYHRTHSLKKVVA